MATPVYVDNASASEASPYDTWAKAAHLLSTITGQDTAGDVIYVISTHAESTNAAITLAVAGTRASPSKIYCVTNNAPPDTLAATAVVATGAGAYAITITGSFYCYGVIFKCGVGATNVSYIALGSADCFQEYEACEFWTSSTSTSVNNYVAPLTSSSVPAATVFRSCNLKFGATAHTITLAGQGSFHWIGGSVLSGSAAITSLIACTNQRGYFVVIEGVDLSNCAQGLVFVRVDANMAELNMIVRNCKLPASWNGSLFSGTFSQPSSRIEMHNCDSADTNYRLWVVDSKGSIKSETGVYRDGGAGGSSGMYTGATELSGFSWLMTGVTDSEYPTIYLRSPEIVQWCGSTGSKTVTVEICHDGAAALTDAEIWIEVEYLSTSGVPLASVSSDRCALMATPQAQATTAAATWTGDSGTGPNGSSTWHLLSLVTPSFTVNEIGYLHARVILAANKSVYVDPLLTIA